MLMLVATILMYTACAHCLCCAVITTITDYLLQIPKVKWGPNKYEHGTLGGMGVQEFGDLTVYTHYLYTTLLFEFLTVFATAHHKL
jgi:hypothetical protein